MKSEETTSAGTTNHVEIGSLDFYVTLVGLDKLQHVIITGPRTDDDVRSLMFGISELVNLALEHGCNALEVADKLINIRGKTGGPTSDPNIPMALSILDYIGKLIRRKYASRGSETSDT